MDVRFAGYSLQGYSYDIEFTNASLSFKSGVSNLSFLQPYLHPIEVYIDGVLIGSCHMVMGGIVPLNMQ